MLRDAAAYTYMPTKWDGVTCRNGNYPPIFALFATRQFLFMYFFLFHLVVFFYYQTWWRSKSCFYALRNDKIDLFVLLENGYHREIVHVMRLFCKINVTRVGLLTCFFLATILDHIFGVSFCSHNIFDEDFMPCTHIRMYCGVCMGMRVRFIKRAMERTL